MRHMIETVAVGAALLSAACASTPVAPVPAEQIASAQDAVHSAREQGAQRVPRARRHLELAQSQVTHAKKLTEEGKNERAEMALSRAHADADLAAALTREASIYTDLQTGRPVTTTPAAKPSPAQAPTPAARPDSDLLPYPSNRAR
jgi:hypothetical protein